MEVRRLIAFRRNADLLHRHLHWDHTGNPSKFPQSVKVILGPDLKENNMPGWPTKPDAEFREEDISGHEVIELSKGDFQINVGGMPGFDYFADGSFYLLDAPGVSTTETYMINNLTRHIACARPCQCPS